MKLVGTRSRLLTFRELFAQLVGSELHAFACRTSNLYFAIGVHSGRMS